MALSIRWFGHSAFTLSADDVCVAIDPFLTANPTAEAAGLSADDLDPTHIALTHGHDDHVGDTPSLAKRTGATVYTSFELCNWLAEKHGVEHLEPGNPGGQIETPFGFIAFTPAFHSSSSGGVYLGQPMGVVVRLGGVTVYHAGDTALFGDMKLIGELYRPDVAILPVGDRFTMGPAHAKIAAEWIGAKVAIPCHYGTWPLLTSDLSAFTPEGISVRALEAGEVIGV